ncbi:AMP-binding enzyme [Necator americanus]|uniref:Long-chain-fatty-acid--CoA ligase n=1 Tax=Necator americanus TaxID=51031 RepID=W2T770_NECAM|nr:AMP-binding enzyme [Necator americanus]ETN77016.1 AMP-binding enzyme [Necator americanus]
MMKDTAVWMHSQGRGFVDLIDHFFVGTSGSSFSSYLSLAAAGAVTMGLGYYLTKTNSNGKITPLVDPLNQTVKQKDGSRITAYLKDGKLQCYIYEDARTLYQGVRRGARVSNNGPMLGRRVKKPDGTEPYEWHTYNEVIERSNDVSIAFRELGIPVGNDTNIGIYCKNRPEWVITELATYNFSNVIVPIYETLGFEACVFILNQTEMQLVVCDTVSKAMGLLEQKPNCPYLKFLVVMEPITNELQAASEAQGVRVLTMDELEKIGREASNKPAHQPSSPEDLATICYTSGTTGTPKGVMLTHANVIADGVCLEFFKYTGFYSTDVMISFLPLAHMLERVIESVCFTKGGRVGFYRAMDLKGIRVLCFRGDIRLLVDDIKELRPTIVPVVPRVLNRLYDKVMSEVNKSYIKKALFNLAIAYKTREMQNFVIRNNGFFDNLVFKKVRESMGGLSIFVRSYTLCLCAELYVIGRVRLMVTGSAPLAENVLTFVRAAMGCVVVEGYGQTECVAACTVSMEGDSNAGHVGMVIPSAKIKLVDVPELGYFSKDEAGEVCVKGPIVFRGYYKNEEQTKEVLDNDGWVHTGDIGRWTKEGTLKIVDRKKHIFKLAQELVHACKKELNLSGTLEELCRNKDVVKMVLDDMIAVGKKSGLFSFEQVKDIYLCPDMFTVENDLLTPTLKSKRPKLKAYFAAELSKMYTKLN